MSKSVAVKKSDPAQASQMARIEQVLIRGDLSVLSEAERIAYYNKVCETVGLNPLTKPFDYITLNGKLVLYANKGCAEQLRQIHAISIRITARETHEGVYVVTAQAERKSDARVDESTGAVTIAGLKGEYLANAMMKAETKSKRRVTLSVCGLNMLDETEVETVVDRKPPSVYPDQPGPEDGDPDHIEPFRFRKGSFARRGLEEAERVFGIEKMRAWVEKVEMRFEKAKKENAVIPDEAVWREDIETCAKFIASREMGMEAPGAGFDEYVGEGIG